MNQRDQQRPQRNARSNAEQDHHDRSASQGGRDSDAFERDRHEGRPRQHAGSGEDRSRWQGYGEYESESELSRNTGGGPPMFEQNRGGGRYSRAARGGDEQREFGTSYGYSSGYAEDQRRRPGAIRSAPQDDPGATGRGAADAGDDYGGGGYGGHYGSRRGQAWGGAEEGYERSSRIQPGRGPGSPDDYFFEGNEPEPPEYAERGAERHAHSNQGVGGQQGRGGGQDFGGGGLGGRQQESPLASHPRGGGGAYGSGYPGEHRELQYERGGWGQGGPRGAHFFRDDQSVGSEQQDHRGRGPKSYTRSDERLKEDVCERLTDDPHVDASELEVKVEGGEVTLTGTVENRWMKYYAEDLVDHCPGVREIHNQLSTPRGGSTQQSPEQTGRSH